MSGVLPGRGSGLCLAHAGWGGTGILSVYVSLSWMVLRPFYTPERVSSTTVLAFLFIPFYAIPAGGLGAVLFSALDVPVQLHRRRNQDIVVPTAPDSLSP